MLGLLMCSSATVLAADGSTSLLPDLSAAQQAAAITALEGRPEAFSAGSLEVHAYGAANLLGEYGDFYQGHVGFGWYFIDDLAFGFEGIAGAFCQDDADATSTSTVGFNLFFRWHPIKRDNWSIYLDLLGGFIIGDESPVEPGTNFNFTPGGGIGATYRLADRLHLMGGARYIHISNANKDGRDRNFGMETAQLYLGVMVPF